MVIKGNGTSKKDSTDYPLECRKFPRIEKGGTFVEKAKDGNRCDAVEYFTLEQL
jgi:hypothetical protein